MIIENSGKFFRFKLDFDLGYGFAEVYDFSDVHHSADSIIVFVYNRVDKDSKKTYTPAEITSIGIALGPITLFKYPNSRGVGAWKFLFQTDTFLVEERPVRKAAQDLAPWVYNWNTLAARPGSPAGVAGGDPGHDEYPACYHPKAETPGGRCIIQ